MKMRTSRDIGMSGRIIIGVTKMMMRVRMVERILGGKNGSKTLRDMWMMMNGGPAMAGIRMGIRKNNSKNQQIMDKMNMTKYKNTKNLK